MEEFLRETFVLIIIFTVVPALFIWMAKSRPKKSPTEGLVFGYSRFITNLFWGIFVFFVVLVIYNLKESGYYSAAPFIMLIVAFLVSALLSLGVKYEYLEVSVDGNVLTKSGLFSGKTTFGWKDVVEMKRSEDGYETPVLLLNNGKKVKFQPAWSGRAEFFRLLSQKRPGLSIKSTGRIYRHPASYRVLLWGFIVVLTTLAVWIMIVSYINSGEIFVLDSFIILALTYSITGFFFWWLRNEYINVSADGNTLIRSRAFTGKTVFTWKDVVEIRLDNDWWKGGINDSEDGEDVENIWPILTLNNGKKIKFQPLSGRKEFLALISQKRPDLFINPNL